MIENDLFVCDYKTSGQFFLDFERKQKYYSIFSSV